MSEMQMVNQFWGYWDWVKKNPTFSCKAVRNIQNKYDMILIFSLKKKITDGY